MGISERCTASNDLVLLSFVLGNLPANVEAIKYTTATYFLTQEEDWIKGFFEILAADVTPTSFMFTEVMLPLLATCRKLCSLSCKSGMSQFPCHIRQTSFTQPNQQDVK